MLSLIVPVFNEEDNIYELYKRTEPVLNKVDKNYEIIFIDDGSTDNSFNVLKELHEKDKKVKIIKFRKNFGQTAAMYAGFRKARGNIVISMDADLQNDPLDIPRLLDKLKEGYDVVTGWRYKRKDPFFTKKIPSKLSNYLARKLTKLEIHDSGCSLRVYKKEAIKDIQIYGEMHRYIPAIIAMKGFKVGEIKVRHHRRRYGEGKYSIRRLLKGFLDLAYIKFWGSYSTRPLHLFGFLGVIQYLLSFLLFVEQVIKAIVLKYFIVGPVLILAVLLTITGTLFILFGFLGEIQIRMYYSKKEPYIIEKILE